MFEGSLLSYNSLVLLWKDHINLPSKPKTKNLSLLSKLISWKVWNYYMVLHDNSGLDWLLELPCQGKTNPFCKHDRKEEEPVPAPNTAGVSHSQHSADYFYTIREAPCFEVAMLINSALEVWYWKICTLCHMIDWFTVTDYEGALTMTNSTSSAGVWLSHTLTQCQSQSLSEA